MSILTTQNLKKHYITESNTVRALDGVSIKITAGEFVAVVGTSGSGKSTLLHMLGGLDKPTEGSVTIEGNELFDMNENELTKFRRRHIGFVFQSYNLVPILSVYENIALPIELDKGKPDQSFIDELLGVLGIADKKYAMPNQLSGGQQQRVAIARALAAKPSVILADEPTGNLDSRTGRDVLDLLKSTSIRFNQNMVVITHNENISRFADRVIHIEDGKIIDNPEGNEDER
ncbi:MAG: ABC transporter ATP-binding protein [Defluviitaleaceae bacterium]|nr:ABC transporter ATP-binding protein [Defluviitaleaceae bacterium]